MDKNFKKKVCVGITWRTAVNVTDQILHIFFTAILARLLTRADFGIVAMALLFTRFVRAFSQIGFGTAIIQNQDVTQGQISAIFIINVVINFIVTIICFASGPFVSIFFAQASLTSVIRVISWTFLIDSFAFPICLKRKEVEFAGISILELFSMIIGNIIGIYFAFTGWGVWALVIRLMVSKSIQAIGIWPIAKWRPTRPSFSGIAPLFNFGLNMLGSNIAHYFSQNLVDIIIGKYIDAKTLGSYTIAYSLALTPSQKVRDILTRVLTPAFSSIQSDLFSLKEKFFISISTVGYIYVPLMLGLSAVAPTLISVIYGPKWLQAGLFLRFIAFVGLMKGIEHILDSVIIARGWANIIFKLTLVEIVICIIFMALGGAYFGVTGLIIGYVAASFLAFYGYIFFSQKAVEDKEVFLSAMGNSLLVGIIMFSCVFILSLFLPTLKVYSLILQIILGATVYIILRLSILNANDRKMFKAWPLPNFVQSRIPRLYR